MLTGDEGEKHHDISTVVESVYSWTFPPPSRPALPQDVLLGLVLALRRCGRSCWPETGIVGVGAKAQVIKLGLSGIVPGYDTIL